MKGVGGMRKPLRNALWAGIALAVSLMMAGSSVAATRAPTEATSWSFAAKSAGPATANTGQVVGNVRGTRSGFTPPQGHYDRVVIDTVSATHGHIVGYNVRYVSEIRGESGMALSLHGAFKLRIDIRAAALNNFGQPTYYARFNHNLPGVSDGLRVVDSVFGGSFEGITTFGLGLNGKQRFRVVQLADGRVAVDILR
jgi:hypothetical protein